MNNLTLELSRNVIKKGTVGRKQNTVEINEEVGWNKSEEQYRRLKKFLNYQVDKCNLVQLQVIGASGYVSNMGCEVNGNLVGFFDNAEKLFKVVRSIAADKVKYKNIFMNLNRVSNSFDAKVQNKLTNSEAAKKFIKDIDITHFKFLYLDLDSLENNKPVTEENLDKSLEQREIVAAYLTQNGFPEPIRGISGNGCYLLYALRNFKNTDEVKNQVRDLIVMLSKKFSTESVKIDTQVFNPGRNIRVPTTINTKTAGDSGVKNRRAMIDKYPDDITAYDFKSFETFHKILSNNENLESEPKNRKINVSRYLSHYNIKVVNEKDQNGATLYCLEECPFDQSHSPNKSSIVQQPDGKLLFQCFHDSCSTRTWHDAREKISGSDKLTDFIDGAGVPGQSTGNQYEDIHVLGMAEVIAYNHISEPYITDILDEGEALLLLGSSGVGKSLFTLFMSLVGAAPLKTALDLCAFEVRKAFSTLFVQSENNIAHTSVRLKTMLELNPQLKEGCNRISLLGRGDDCRVTGVLSDTKFQEKMMDGIVESNADVVIVDPFISFHSCNENDNGEIRKELDCLKRVCEDTGASVVLVHHIAKTHTAENKGGRGASAIADWADRIIFLERENKGGKDCLKLTCQKSRNSVPFNDFYIDISDFKFERLSNPGDEKTDVVVKALDELGGAANTQDELANKIKADGNVSMSTAKRYIKQAVEVGFVNQRRKLTPQQRLILTPQN